MSTKQFLPCLLCESSAELKHDKFPGYQKPDTFKIYYCSKCNTSFSQPRVEAKKTYEAIYNNGDSVPYYNRYWNYAKVIKNVNNPLEFLSNTEDTYWGVKEALNRIVKNKNDIKIIELGSGLGYLTYALRMDDYNVIGLDISQTAVKNAVKNFGEFYICTDLFEYSSKNIEKFDIVILTEVIEHINMPVEFIRSILKILKKSGTIILTTPNKSFYPKKITWATELPPIHCWWFSEESFSYISKILNVTVSFIDFTNFYKNQYQMVDLKNISINTLEPTLDKNGSLIRKENNQNERSKITFRSLFSKLPYLKLLYRKLRKILNPEILECNKRGTVLCTLLQKT